NAYGYWSLENAYDVTSLTYDDNGNMAKVSRRNQYGSGAMNYHTYGDAGSNRLTSASIWPSIQRAYTYDANGNTLDDDAFLTGTTYDIFNMPVQISTTQATAYNR